MNNLRLVFNVKNDSIPFSVTVPSCRIDNHVVKLCIYPIKSAVRSTVSNFAILEMNECYIQIEAKRVVKHVPYFL